jgi:hypothetical protein
MKTTAQHAKEIRTELKSLSLTSKDVSVRSRVYSMGSSIDVSIKSEKGLSHKEKIEAAAKNHESIDYDSLTGEILCGGNQFVFVGIDHELESRLLNKHTPEIFGAIQKAMDNPNDVVELWGVRFFYDGEHKDFRCMDGPTYWGAEQFAWFLLRQKYH